MSRDKDTACESDSSSDEEDCLLSLGTDLFVETDTAAQKRNNAAMQAQQIHSRTWGADPLSDYHFHFKDGRTLFFRQEACQHIKVWDCAIVLARFLEDNPALVEGKDCVELGCGVGLPGLAAATLGAKSVLLTDRPHAVESIGASIDANQETWGSSCGSCRALGLEWQLSKPGPQPLRADCVLCSDLIYAGDTAITRALVNTVVALRPSLLVCCHEVRFEDSELEARKFFEGLSSAGFNVSAVPYESLRTDARAETILVHLVRCL